jgi:hypothetical protein
VLHFVKRAQIDPPLNSAESARAGYSTPPRNDHGSHSFCEGDMRSGVLFSSVTELRQASNLVNAKMVEVSHIGGNPPVRTI